MGLETDLPNKEKVKEFETLLNEDFKKREFKEGKIIKATVSEIGKKFVFVETGLKSEGSIPIEEFKISVYLTFFRSFFNSLYLLRALSLTFAVI